MKLILEIDLEYAMSVAYDPPQNEWSESDFEDNLIKQLREYLDKLEADIGASITLQDEKGNNI